MLHPVFVTSKATRQLEFTESQTTTERGVIRTYNIRDYLHVPPWQGFAISGQPELQVRLPKTLPFSLALKID